MTLARMWQQCRAQTVESAALFTVGLQRREAIMFRPHDQHHYYDLDGDHDHQQREELALSDIHPAEHDVSHCLMHISAAVDDVTDTFSDISTSPRCSRL